MRRVTQFVDIGRFYGLGEARPAASRFEFVGRSEQRLARHNIDIDTRFLVIQIFSSSGTLSLVLLRYAILLRRELLDRFVTLGKLSHFLLLGRDLLDVTSHNVTPNVGPIDTLVHSL